VSAQSPSPPNFATHSPLQSISERFPENSNGAENSGKVKGTRKGRND